MTAENKKEVSKLLARVARNSKNGGVASPPSPVAPKTEKQQQDYNRALASVMTRAPLDNTDTLAIPIESTLELKVMDIRAYDHNPRKTENDHYLEIKESIRNSAILSPLVVTKRPGETHYMIMAGGNTRLRAQQELWRETGDYRFGRVVVTFRPWKSEATVLTAHLVENEVRGEMTFWDKARGVWALKAMLEAETGDTLSARALESELQKRGLTVSRTTLSYYAFALDHLQALDEAASALSKTMVQLIQPSFTQLERLVKHARDAAAFSSVSENVLRSLARSWQRSKELDAQGIVSAMDSAVALTLGESVDTVRAIRELAISAPNDPIERLMAQVKRPKTQPTAQLSDDDAKERSFAKQFEGTSQRPANLNREAKQQTKAAPEALGLDNAAQQPINPELAANLSTSSTHRTVDESDASVATQSLLALAKAFANEAKLGHLFRLHESMPYGFYFECPTVNDNLGFDHPRHIAWWVGAALCGQLDEFNIDLLPAHSAFRLRYFPADMEDETQEQAQRSDSEYGTLIESILGGNPMHNEVAQWLVDPSNSLATAYLKIVHAIRLQEGADDPRDMPNKGQPGGHDAT